MEITLKKLKKLEVYEKNTNEPLGKVKCVCFSKDRKKVDALYVETHSIIPLNKKFFIEEFGEIFGEKVFLKDGICAHDAKLKSEKDISEERVLGVYEKDGTKKKLYDMSFDFGTGEISTMVLRNGLFRKNNRVEINNMHIKDNTIYIE